MKVKYFGSIIKFIFIGYASLYVAFHVLLFTVPQTVMYLTFHNFINYPFGNLSNPTEFGLNNVYNFYINTDVDVKIGVWHFIPSHQQFSKRDEYDGIEEHLSKYLINNDRPIIIFSHGNAGNRAWNTNKMISIKLCKMNYHVFSLDYRGFGDSTGWPSEQGVVHDLISLYNLIKSHNRSSQIYFYGHSLGTGVVAHAARILSERNDPVSGVILEAPFLNVSHAAREYAVADLFYNNPWIISVADQALRDMDLHFSTNKHISKIDSKILIIHSENDGIISHHRSLDLMRIAELERLPHYPSIQLNIIDKAHKIGHTTLYTHDDIYPVISDFIQ